MAEYTVGLVMKTKEYEGKYGKMAVYAVQLEGETDTVELVQKVETPEPKTGDKLNGTIEDSQFGRKFKKEAPAGGYQRGGGGGASNKQTSLTVAERVVAAYSKGREIPADMSLEDYTAKVLETAKSLDAHFGAPETDSKPATDHVPSPAEIESGIDNINLDEIPF